MYMETFWGHDQNLMYYRNHVYPLMGPGWGSTADYILLSDNDTVDLAMFSNWEFWTKGTFAAFDKDEYSVTAGSALAFQTLKYDTQSVADGGTEQFDPISGLDVRAYDENWKEVAQLAAILYRYAKQKGYDVTKSAALTGFSDAAQVSGYAAEAMQWAVAEGFLQGSNGRLDPQGSATRAQVAAILMRFMENIAK